MTTARSPQAAAERARDEVVAWLRALVAGQPAPLGPVDGECARILRATRLEALAVHHGAQGPALAEAARAAFAQSVVRRAVTERTVRVLRRGGVRCVVIKGLPLAARYWGDPAVRPSADVDVLVGRANVDRARALLSAAEFVLDDEIPWWYWRTMHFHVTWVSPDPHRVAVEVHWDFKRKGYRRTPVEWLLDEAGEVGLGDVVMPAPSPAWQLLISSAAALHHGLPLRDLFDVALIGSSLAAREWPGVARRARAAGVDQMVYWAVTASARALDWRPPVVLEQMRPQPWVEGRVRPLIEDLALVKTPSPGSVRRIKFALTWAAGPRAPLVYFYALMNRPEVLSALRRLPPLGGRDYR